jgi:hypothetical protein
MLLQRGSGSHLSHTANRSIVSSGSNATRVSAHHIGKNSARCAGNASSHGPLQLIVPMRTFTFTYATGTRQPCSGHGCRLVEAVGLRHRRYARWRNGCFRFLSPAEPGSCQRVVRSRSTCCPVLYQCPQLLESSSNGDGGMLLRFWRCGWARSARFMPPFTRKPSKEAQAVENKGAAATAARLRAMIPASTDPEWLEKMAHDIESAGRRH